MLRLLRLTIVVGGVALMMSSMASQTMADRINSKDLSLNGDCAQSALRDGEPPSSLTLANLNLQVTQTGTIFASDGKSSRGGAFVISSFNSGGGSGGRRYTIPPASHVSLAAAVPEPTTLLLLGTGLAGLAALLRRRLRAR